MQLFTIEQLFQMRLEAWGLVKSFLGAGVDSLLQYIVEFLSSLYSAFIAHEWSDFVFQIILVAGFIAFIVRLVRRMPARLLDSI